MSFVDVVVASLERGDMDRELARIRAALDRRGRMLDPDRQPAHTPEMVSAGQIWVWDATRKPPCWEKEYTALLAAGVNYVRSEHVGNWTPLEEPERVQLDAGLDILEHQHRWIRAKSGWVCACGEENSGTFGSGDTVEAGPVTGITQGP